MESIKSCFIQNFRRVKTGSRTEIFKIFWTGTENEKLIWKKNNKNRNLTRTYKIKNVSVSVRLKMIITTIEILFHDS